MTRFNIMTKKSLSEFYQEFTSARERTGFCGAPLSYHWLELPNSHDLLLPYGMTRYLWSDIASSLTRDIANAINALSIHARNFEAWHQVLDSLEREESFRIHHEFISSNAVVALSLPYSIKSRFYYAIAHLSHHANRFREGELWREDNLPKDNEINQEVAAKLSKSWKGWKKTSRKLERCDSRAFRDETLNFRNKYMHRHDLLVGVEAAQPVERQLDTDTGKASYNFGGTYAMELSEISQLVKAEFEAFSQAYIKFQEFVNEQKETVFRDV